jgi:hypothetical protein
MVAKYYVAVRPQINENHAVHKEGCPFLPDDNKRIYLGKFSSDQAAIKESKHHFTMTKCCIFCSKEIKIFEEKPPLFNRTNEKAVPAKLTIPASFHQSLLCCVN